MGDSEPIEFFFSHPFVILDDPDMVLNDPADGSSSSFAIAVDSESGNSVKNQVSWDLHLGIQTMKGKYAMKIDPIEFGSDFTFELIFKFTELGSDQTLLKFGDASIESSLIVSRIGEENKLKVDLISSFPKTFSAQMKDENALLASMTNPSHSDFVHLVVVYKEVTEFDGAKVSIYINGVEQTVSNSFTGGASDADKIPNETRSGLHLIGNSNPGNGNERIKVLRFLPNTVKTPEEVVQMFQTVKQGTPLLSSNWTDAWIRELTGGLGGGGSNNQPVTATGAPLSVIPKNLIL